jgi:putative ABC transport system ATP-binding protein
VNDPAIILADEPTGNLDTKTSVEIMELFGKIHAGGNTVVPVTHEEDIANYTNRIVRIRDGVVEKDIVRSYVGESLIAK